MSDATRTNNTSNDAPAPNAEPSALTSDRTAAPSCFDKLREFVDRGQAVLAKRRQNKAACLWFTMWSYEHRATDTVRVSERTLAEVLGTDRTSVCDAIAVLEHFGLLRVLEKGEQGRARCAVYRLFATPQKGVSHPLIEGKKGGDSPPIPEQKRGRLTPSRAAEKGVTHLKKGGDSPPLQSLTEKKQEEEPPPLPPAEPGGGRSEGGRVEEPPEVGPTPAAVVAHWNAHPGLTPAIAAQVNRDRKIRLWATDRPLWGVHWRAAIAFMGRTPFYCGRGERGWRAQLAWLFDGDNFDKVVERMLAAPTTTTGAHRDAQRPGAGTIRSGHRVDAPAGKYAPPTGDGLQTRPAQADSAAAAMDLGADSEARSPQELLFGPPAPASPNVPAPPVAAANVPPSKSERQRGAVCEGLFGSSDPEQKLRWARMCGKPRPPDAQAAEGDTS